MFWLYLLATVTILTIALRRVVLRQKPLDDEVFSRAVAFEHVHSGIAWIKNDGTVMSMNASLAGTFQLAPKDARGMNWYDLFAKSERARLESAYSQMLLAGKAQLDVYGRNMTAAIRHSPGGNGSDTPELPGLDLLIVAVHDHKMRFIGHHCLVADRTKERALEAQIRELRQQIDLMAMRSGTEQGAAVSVADGLKSSR